MYFLFIKRKAQVRVCGTAYEVPMALLPAGGLTCSSLIPSNTPNSLYQKAFTLVALLIDAFSNILWVSVSHYIQISAEILLLQRSCDEIILKYYLVCHCLPS